jgi:phosphatidylinositol alpha-1,6-mannosyltransferase
LAHKGVDLVLRAFAQLSPALPEARVVVVGDGPEYERLTTLARDLGIDQRVHFTGGVNDARLVEWYRAADVFVLPARSEPPTVEGFGTVYLEASACGLPVIGPDEGGPVDAIIEGQTGLRVPPRDLDALAAAMGRLGRDPRLRDALGRRGRQHVIEEANWDRVADRLWVTMQVLDQQAKTRQSPP